MSQDQPYYVAAMRSVFAQERQRLDAALGGIEEAGLERSARHAANRQMTLELIAVRKRRNVVARAIESNPKTFATACVVIYLSYSFWSWWLTSPGTRSLSAPLRDVFSGWAW